MNAPRRAVARGLASRSMLGLRALGHAATAFLLPQRCPACGAPASSAWLLCDACLAAVPLLDLALCARCLRIGGDPAACRTHRGRVEALWLYEARAAAVVHALKYRSRQGLARGFGWAMAGARKGPVPDAVVAVPLHPVRRLVRGYNQAAALAEAVAAASGRPRFAGVIARRRWTRPQTRLGERARRSNVAGAFRVVRPAWIRGRHIEVVDDVMTTGATMDEVMGELEAAGARVSGLVLAWAQ